MLPPFLKRVSGAGIKDDEPLFLKGRGRPAIEIPDLSVLSADRRSGNEPTIQRSFGRAQPVPEV